MEVVVAADLEAVVVGVAVRFQVQLSAVVELMVMLYLAQNLIVQ